MPKLTVFDPTRTGRPAEDLENKLRHRIVGAVHINVEASLSAIYIPPNLGFV
jgi:hypothetical protein